MQDQSGRGGDRGDLGLPHMDIDGVALEPLWDWEIEKGYLLKFTKRGDIMASCKWENGKLHGAAEVKARLRHCDTSVEYRTIAQIGNPHIDLTKSKDNMTRYGRSYAECCGIYDARIAELDKNPKQNHRQDRVTMCCVEVPAPKDLPPEQAKAWFDKLGGIFEKRYGKENMIEMFVHVDEVHDYDNAETGNIEESRIHAHICFVPVDDNGKLNAKALSLRGKMKSLNNAVHKMSEDEFGCSFMTGTKKRSVKTVSQLKNESSNRQLKRETEEAKEKIAKAEQQMREASAVKLQAQGLQRNMGFERKKLDDEWAAVDEERRKNERDRAEIKRDRSALEADRASFDDYKENYKAGLQEQFKTARTTLEEQMESKYINIADVVQVLKAYADEHEAMKIAAEQSAKQNGRLPSEIRKEVRSSAAMIRDIFGRRNDIMDYRNQRTHELGE